LPIQFLLLAPDMPHLSGASKTVGHGKHFS
jgi:hypothetical protein